MGEAKTCPKCGGEMEKAYFLKASSFIFDAKEVYIATNRRGGVGDKMIPFYCKKCGFIELYRKMEDKKE